MSPLARAVWIAFAWASLTGMAVAPALADGLDPAARLLTSDAAQEYWDLYIELESGHRVTQRILLTNVGPGSHTAVAVGHLAEPGRAPYRYENGRRRGRWKLSEDRLFFDIAASHLDLHRPKGELRISKQDIQIQLFFDFEESPATGRIPTARLPDGLNIEVLTIGAATQGRVQGPWMDGPVETSGRTWLVHVWSRDATQDHVRRRVELFGEHAGESIYGLHLSDPQGLDVGWILRSKSKPDGPSIESIINVPARWLDRSPGQGPSTSRKYPIPGGFDVSGEAARGKIDLKKGWLRFDPLGVIPQPFRWFIRMTTSPQQVWADARIDVTLFPAPNNRALPPLGEPDERYQDVSDSREIDSSLIDSNSRSKPPRESTNESAEQGIEGVVSITFLNPVDRR